MPFTTSVGTGATVVPSVGLTPVPLVHMNLPSAPELMQIWDEIN